MSSCFSYKRLNLNLKVVLEGHFVAMVTYWAMLTNDWAVFG